LVVHGVHSGSSLIVVGEADETETTAAAGVTVPDDSLGRKNGSLRGMRSVIGVAATHSILDNAEFLEALAQTVVVCVPGKTARKGRSARGMLDILLGRSYPMKSFDILMEMGRDGERGEGC
jgi:hypothetical protein